MFTLNVKVDQALLLQRLEKGHKRFGYAVANALNDTAREIQTRVQRHVREEFTLRPATEKFVLRQAAIIKPFANPREGRPYVELSVGTPKRLLLSDYEEGGERLPFKGSTYVAMPVIGGPARPTFASPVPAEWRVQKLGLRLRPRREGAKVRKTESRVAVRFGLHGTYQIPRVGIFQHTPGSKRRFGLGRPVYYFLRHEELPDRLDFREIATATTREVFDRELASQVDDVLIRRGLTRASLA